MGTALFGGAAMAWVAACAGKPPAKSTAGPAASASAEETPDAAPVERPFAASSTEATQLVNDAVDAKGDDIRLCVRAARQRSGKAHARMEIQFGIDQEGHLIGVRLTKAQKHDEPLVECVRAALKNAAFPRSHSGIITITRSYEEIQL